MSDHIGYKQKRLDQANNIQNYKGCDELSEQISALKGDRRKLEAEQKALMKKQKKNKLYEDAKSRASRSSTEVECSDQQILSRARSSSSSFTSPSPPSSNPCAETDGSTIMLSSDEEQPSSADEVERDVPMLRRQGAMVVPAELSPVISY